MLNIKKILLPVDFQSPGLSVVHQAAGLARRFHSEVIVLHALTPLSYSAGELPGAYVPASRDDLLAELIRQAERQLERCLKPELEGLKVQRLLRKGDPAMEIVKAARELAADLIVMPTHGYGPFRRFLLGSVTAKVLHDSDCPVWTGAHIEEQAPSAFAIRKIICAIDLSEHSRNTISWAAQMAAEFGAQLIVAHIVAEPDVYSSVEPHDKAEWQKALVSSAAKRIAEIQREVGSSAPVFIGSGNIPDALSRTALDQKADLLVIGRNPSAGHLRGTGYGLIRESRLPVLSV
jgi:nucleotide-binding universal stress UspA family protein